VITRLPIPLTGGVNTFQDSTTIEDNQLQRALNFSARTSGRPGTRLALQSVREVIPDYRPWDSRRYNGLATEIYRYYQWAQNWRPMKFMFTPQSDELAWIAQSVGSRIVVHTNADGTQTQKTVEAGTAILQSSGGVQTPGADDGVYAAQYMGGLTRCPSLFVFNGIVYAFGGTEGGQKIERYPGATVAGVSLGWAYAPVQWNTAQLTPFIPDGAAVIRDRVLYYKGPLIFWSDKGDPEQIFANSMTDGYIPVASEELEDITAAAEISTSADGSPVQSTAAVWSRNHCYLILGEPLQTGDDLTTQSIYGSMQINRLNIEAGCISQATVTRTPYGTFWVGADDVWFMPFGSLPIRVGTNIRDRIRAIPPGLSWRICAEYSDGFYRIALMSEGNGPSAFSPLDEMWWLDLNQGPPQNSDSAKWWGPHQFVNGDAPDVDPDSVPLNGIWALARDQRAGSDGALYALQPYWMVAGPASVYGMTLCSFSSYAGRDCGAPQKILRRWQASTPYYEGDEVTPPANTSALDWRMPTWVCTVAGASGLGEPNWLASTATSIVEASGLTWRPIYYAGTTPLNAHIPPAYQSGNDIQWRLSSKEYTLGDPAVEKLLDGADLVYVGDGPSSVTYSTNPDQTSNTRTLPTSGSTLDQNTGTLAANQNRKYRRLLTADPTSRFNAITATMDIQHLTGFTIVAGLNDTLYIRLRAGFGGGLASYTVTIAPGYYQNLYYLAEAVRTALLTPQSIGQPVITLVHNASPSGLNALRFGWSGSTLGDVTDIWKLSVLAAYFGFTTEDLLGGNTAPTLTYGSDSPYFKAVYDLQIMDIQLRYAAFGRRAT
jgi:hypothetical protein